MRSVWWKTNRSARQSWQARIKIYLFNDYLNKKWYFVFENGSHPYVLTQKDYEKLISSDMLFARKFDINCNAKILDLLDETVHKSV